MSAVPAALAQIEERLQEIRYRLNMRTLMAVVCPILAALFVLASLLVWSAARATPESFTLAAWAAAGAGLLVLFRALMALSQRWLSLAQAVRLADDGGGMQDRLTTLFWLRRSGEQPSLGPVLVADAIDRSAAWSPAVLVPRRFPLELGYPLAGIAALAAMLLYVRLVPPLVMPLPKPGPAPMQQSEGEVPPPPAPGGLEQKRTDPLLAFDVTFDGSEASGGGDGAEEGEATALTEQLRRVIKKAVGRPEPAAGDGSETRGTLSAVKLDGQGDGAGTEGQRSHPGQQQMGESQLPLGERDEQGGDSGMARKPGQPGEDASENAGRAERPPQGKHDKKLDRRRAVEGDPHEGGRKDEDLPSMPGSEAPPDTLDGKGKPGPESNEEAEQGKLPSKQAKANESKGGPPRPMPNDPQGRGTRPGGAKAGAGTGTDAEGLFAPKGAAGTQVTRAPSAGTFKLTLGSFLAAAPGGGNDKPKDRNRVAAGGGREAVAEPPALHPNQTADDAMRRADVPPEYEDIVRRIYSARPPVK